ncbi:MAG: beta-glycosidase [Bacteroidales bacterium]|nr:beta-glycosidase [Bacteroidales bacterium]
MKIVYLLPLLAFLSCNTQKEQYRQYINLEGEWKFALDTAETGIDQKWYLSELNDSILLHGTMDQNQKGFLNKDTTTFQLNRLYKYEGAAWYRTKVNIPDNFEDKHITLFLERTKSSKIWIDSTYIGGSTILQSPQQFDVSDYLFPGEHTITICIDNSLKLTPYGYVHIYSDDTQTNWNGIIGKIYIEASAKTYISNLQVYPDIEKEKIDVEIEIVNGLNLDNVDIELFVDKTVNSKTTKLKPYKTSVKCGSKIKLEYDLGDKCSLWDEYQQPLYHLTAVITNGENKDSKTVPFGMRKFSVKGTQFAINGRTVFLRGKHEAGVFPLTGCIPANVEEWQRVYKIVKSYGINHYRFHSYCPPEAAFTAADLEGIYLQAELPFWGGLDADSIADMLLEEGYAMLKSYANHPSFVMFSHGNEIWSGHERIEKNLMALKEYDSRPLYTMGSNNGIGYIPPSKSSDFFVGARTPYAKDTILTHIRLTHAYVDSKDGGILNTQTPSTLVNFNYSVNQINMPVISHEIGQYQIFPDNNEIDKYTGVLKPWNLEVFRNRLINAGMDDMDSAFHMASGAWSALCYKAEMEAAIRTKGFAGFQLLDLQDYPGQGTALVGILDAFMDSKNVITPEEWKQSCNDVVLLLEFPKYCWTNEETFHATLVVANYSNQAIANDLHWEIQKAEGKILKDGTISNMTLPNEGLTNAGEIYVDLSSVSKPEKLNVFITVKGTSYKNNYPLWVYPPITPIQINEDIIIAEKLDNKLITKLEEGAKVFLLPQTEDIKINSFPGLFPPEFWNYGMFKGISEWAKKPVSPSTLGLLMNPDHPLFNDFPTDFHTNWQWFSIIKASNSFILDNTPDDYFPIVQVIDNLERNHKLGLIFEFKVGKGKLLVCTSQLNLIMDKPEAVQLYCSIIEYMRSEVFNPEYELNNEELIGLFVHKEL